MKPAFPILFSCLTLVGGSRAAVVTNGFVTNTGTLTNWAIGGATSGTAQDFGATLGNANDGNTNGNFGGGSVTHSDGSTNSFWSVDLGANRPVEGIALWNRTDCCGDRLSNYNVQVRDASNAVVFSQNYFTSSGSAGVREAIGFNPTLSGRYVTVSLLGNNLAGNGVLSLAEVQVMGHASASSFANVAVLGTANQSSTGFGGVAGRANDGNTDGVFNNGSVTHTADNVAIGSPVFWEVQLPQDYAIGEIALFNRTDCCGERLSNFRVSIFDGNTEVYGSNQFAGSGAAGNIFSLYENAGGVIGTGDRVRIEYIGGLNNSGAGANGLSLSLAEVQVFGRAVPEPATAGSLAVASLVALRRRRRK